MQLTIPITPNGWGVTLNSISPILYLSTVSNQGVNLMETNIFAAIALDTQILQYRGMFNNHIHTFHVISVAHNYNLPATMPHVEVLATDTETGKSVRFQFYGVGKDMMVAHHETGETFKWYNRHVWVGSADDETMQPNTWYFLGGE